MMLLFQNKYWQLLKGRQLFRQINEPATNEMRNKTIVKILKERKVALEKKKYIHIHFMKKSKVVAPVNLTS